MNTPDTSVKVASAGEAKFTGSTCVTRSAGDMRHKQMGERNTPDHVSDRVPSGNRGR